MFTEIRDYNFPHDPKLVGANIITVNVINESFERLSSCISEGKHSLWIVQNIKKIICLENLEIQLFTLDITLRNWS